MIIVLDTSAAIEVVLKRKQFSSLQDVLANADWVIAPYLYIAEATNAFWKYFHHSDMAIDSCEKAIDLAISLPDDFISEKELFKEAFALACMTKMTVYDMFYLVLARRNNGCLLTLDKSLKLAAEKQSIKTNFQSFLSD